jgi:DAK2 domain fusion protein YloV
MRAAYNQIKDGEDAHVGRVAHELAHGALMGARGNSGVILSQIWRGMARSLANKEVALAADIAEALHAASDTAYKGVMRPVEGTILTVIRESSEEAREAAKKSRDLRFVLDRVLERAQQSLERTPELLPVLKQAGVVDSGGQGLVYILEGMLRYVAGEMQEAMRAVEVSAQLPAQALAVPESGALEFPYDVQFILMGEQLDVETVRRTIDAMGDSTVVVGDERTIKVHIHVKNPGEPLSYGVSLGRLADVVVENMQLQMEEIIAPALPEAARAFTPPLPVLEPGHIAVVAVAAGPGLADIFRSLGAAGIVNGGQSNNPSTEEIYQAIESLPADKVIVLPNNKNIVLAAEAACGLTRKQVAVVPTRTVPQGISAMLSLDPAGELESVCETMAVASRDIVSGEITVATRTVRLDGVDVTEGQYIGLVDGRLCVADGSLQIVLGETLRRMNIGDRELLSLYYGKDATSRDAETLAEAISASYPELEVEVLPGGQPHYLYILGAE